MLKGTKSMNLSYSSIIDGKSVVYMSAQVPETGKSNCTKTIQDQEMYEANKAECRKDMAAFDELLWKLEDQGTVDTAKNTDTEVQFQSLKVHSYPSQTHLCFRTHSSYP